MHDNVGIYKERRDALIDGLAAPGEGAWKIEKPLGTMFVWAPIPEPFVAWARSSSRSACCAEAQVAVSPGIGFGEHGEGYVRFALVENRHRIRQAVRGIRRFLRGDQGSPLMSKATKGDGVRRRARSASARSGSGVAKVLAAQRQA